MWYVLRAIPVLATAIMFMSQVGPKDAAANLGKWLEWLGLSVPDWLLAPRIDRIAFWGGAITLTTWLCWYFWDRLTPHLETGWLQLQRRSGYVDGRWTWRLRPPWEHLEPRSGTQATQTARPVSFYEAAVDRQGSTHEVIASYLFALDDIIGKPASNPAEVNNQAQAFQALRAEIVAFVRGAVSPTAAYDLANPGLSIVAQDPKAVNQAHNSLLHSMRELRQGLRHVHLLTSPLPRIASTEPSAPPQPPATGDTVVATGKLGPPLYYSQGEKDRLLAAMGSIARMITQNAVPVRNAVDGFLGSWRQTLANQGAAYVLDGLNQLRQSFATMAETIQIIEQDYADHREHVSDVFVVYGFSHRLLEATMDFRVAIEKLPPQLGEHTLDLLEPAERSLRSARNAFQTWIESVEHSRKEKTQKLRTARSNSE